MTRGAFLRDQFSSPKTLFSNLLLPVLQKIPTSFDFAKASAILLINLDKKSMKYSQEEVPLSRWSIEDVQIAQKSVRAEVAAVCQKLKPANQGNEVLKMINQASEDSGAKGRLNLLFYIIEALKLHEKTSCFSATQVQKLRRLWSRTMTIGQTALDADTPEHYVYNLNKLRAGTDRMAPEDNFFSLCNRFNNVPAGQRGGPPLARPSSVAATVKNTHTNMQPSALRVGSYRTDNVPSNFCSAEQTRCARPDQPNQVVFAYCGYSCDVKNTTFECDGNLLCTDRTVGSVQIIDETTYDFTYQGKTARFKWQGNSQGSTQSSSQPTPPVTGGSAGGYFDSAKVKLDALQEGYAGNFVAVVANLKGIQKDWAARRALGGISDDIVVNIDRNFSAMDGNIIYLEYTSGPNSQAHARQGYAYAAFALKLWGRLDNK